jgi:hypothetical protein
MFTPPREYGDVARNHAMFQLRAQGGQAQWGTFSLVVGTAVAITVADDGTNDAMRFDFEILRRGGDPAARSAASRPTRCPRNQGARHRRRFERLPR